MYLMLCTASEKISLIKNFPLTLRQATCLILYFGWEKRSFTKDVKFYSNEFYNLKIMY